MKTNLLMLLIVLSSISFSQWTNDYSVNTLVSDVITSDITSIGTSDGKTYVIFYDDSSGQYVLKAQLLDVNGNKLFGNEGIIVNDTAPMGSFTMNRSENIDAENNLFIVFTDSGSDSANAYLHKISPTGEQLFSEQGIIVGEQGYSVDVMPVSDGVFVFWMDKMMKYDNEGIPVWAEPKNLPVLQEGNTVYPAEFVVLNDGSFILGLHDNFGIVESNIWAQKFSAEGEPQWDNPIQISDLTSMHNRSNYMLTDGENAYYSYFGVTANDTFEGYLQKINADGTLPWGINGSAVSTNSEFNKMYNSAVIIGDNVWTASTFTDFVQGPQGLFVQKFNKNTGERLLGDSAKEIFALSIDNPKSLAGHLQAFEDKPLILFRDELDFGNQNKLGVTYLNENGEFVWDDQFKYLAAFDGSYKYQTYLTNNVSNQSIIVWTEDRSAGSKVYAQNFLLSDHMSIDDLDGIGEISVYPNPVKDILNISSKKKIKEISVFNIAGQKVLNSINVKNGQLNVSSLSSGVYVFQVKMENGKVETFKIIKK